MSQKLDHIWSILTRTEMWAAIAAILAAIYEANVLPESWAKLVAVALAVFAALGYGVARTIRKNAVEKADAMVEIAKAGGAANPQ